MSADYGRQNRDSGIVLEKYKVTYYFTYILRSEEKGKYYIGSCQNLSERLAKHNKGRVKSTKPYKPWKMVYSKKFESRSEAYKREFEIKGLKSRKAIEKIIVGA